MQQRNEYAVGKIVATQPHRLQVVAHNTTIAAVSGEVPNRGMEDRLQHASLDGRTSGQLKRQELARCAIWKSMRSVVRLAVLKAQSRLPGRSICEGIRGSGKDGPEEPVTSCLPALPASAKRAHRAPAHRRQVLSDSSECLGVCSYHFAQSLSQAFQCSLFSSRDRLRRNLQVGCDFGSVVS